MMLGGTHGGGEMFVGKVRGHVVERGHAGGEGGFRG